MAEPHAAENIYPSLTYEDAPAAIEWLGRALGFEQRLVVPGPDGTVFHSELTFGQSVVMVSSPKPEAGRSSPGSLGGVTCALSLWVEDPDALFERAKQAGAEVMREPRDEEYGGRGFMVKDPEGYGWYFGTYRPGAYWDGATGD